MNNKVKIFKEIWAVTRPIEKIGQYDDQDKTLAYMCQATKASDAGFKKRRETGTGWARCRGWHEDVPVTKYPTENTYANVPTTGFKLGKSVTRYSTSNKLIRITDPRGFTVEISISCLATLLEDVTVEKGVIKDECVWGRLGSDNVLVSTNSIEYKEAYKIGDSGKVKWLGMKDVEIGSVVELSVSGTIMKFIYIGKLHSLLK